ncbi:hypothetical protein ACQP1U_01645 [Actinomycetota bacterium]
MGVGDFFSRLGGRDEEERLSPPGPPTREEIEKSLDRVEELAAGAAVPSVVTARVDRVVRIVRETLPALQGGSDLGYNVMATATDYLPEAVGGYLRLPRRFADTRPVDRGRTSLMVLVDQLDLLAMTMDQVYDAIHRADATALVAHGRFLEEKFGHHGTGGGLDAAGVPAPRGPVIESDGPEGQEGAGPASPPPAPATPPPGPAAPAPTPLQPPDPV